MPRIGFVRSLEYYHLNPYWEVVCRTLGLEPFAPEARRADLADALGRFEPELCYPIRVYLAQVERLLAGGEVDFLFVPFVESLKRGVYACTKFVMLPDLVAHYFPDLGPYTDPALLTIWLHRQYDGVDRFDEYAGQVRALAERVGEAERAGEAAAAGRAAQLRYEENLRRGRRRHHDVPWDRELAPEPFPEVVLLLGHKYTLHDPLLNAGIPEALERAGLPVATKENLWPPEPHVDCAESLGFTGDVFFAEGAELFAATARAATDPRVRGILYLTHFACGFDAVIEDLIRRRIIAGSDKPYLNLVLDEHFSRANTTTKLEVFERLVREHERRCALAR